MSDDYLQIALAGDEEHLMRRLVEVTREFREQYQLQTSESQQGRQQSIFGTGLTRFQVDGYADDWPYIVRVFADGSVYDYNAIKAYASLEDCMKAVQKEQ